MLEQPDDSSTDGDLASDVGNEIEVTLDRWSAGQLGVTDLLIAAGVIVAGVLLAWLVSRLAKRISRRTEGAARAAIATAGLLIGSSIVVVTLAVALEVLGFGLGPILVLILLIVALLLLLGPIITNLSSGVLLQVRRVFAAGDLVKIDGTLGTVHEINARTVVLDTSDGRRVYIPNSEALNEEIENFTQLGRRRSSFEVMVEVGTDIDHAMTVISEAVQRVDSVLTEPEPEVEVGALAGRFVIVRVFVWHGPDLSNARTAVDEGIRSVLSALNSELVELSGPSWMGLDLQGAQPGEGR